MKQTHDADEAFTFRRIEREFPSKKLEETVSAVILGFAKERFRKRKLNEAPSKCATPAKREPLSSDDGVTSGAEGSGDDQDTDSDEASNSQSKATSAASQKLLQPVVATDDDVSYELIQPSTRSILHNLDQALTVLHNTRMTSAQNLWDTAASSSSEDEDFYNEATPSRRSRSRSRGTPRASTTRSRSHSLPQLSTDGETSTRAKKKSNRGRKPELVLRDGESQREFLIRRAKTLKKKRPVFSDDEVNKEEEGEEEGNTAAQSTKKSSRIGRQSRSHRQEGRGSAVTNAEYWQQKRLERLNLRDWSDVMGAAALAGFSSKVIARATQRCANLFGQGMEMHTIDDGVETKHYVPGEAVPDTSSESENEDDSIIIRRARSMSRHSSMAPSKAASPETSGSEEKERLSPRKRQKQSLSRSGAAKAQHYCPHIDCERAVTGFDRPYNLKRHIKLVHQGQEVDNVETEEAKDEKLDGGVHLDGFLQPIRMQRGWRAEDTTTRARKLPQKQHWNKAVSEGESGLTTEDRGIVKSQSEHQE